MTWSIVAADAETGEAGVAVASCVELDVVLLVPGIAPDHGAIATQSFLLEGGRDRGVDLLASGLSADQVLASLLDPSFDPDFSQRQIAIVDVEGHIATFTGPEALTFAGHATARFGSTAISVQGNLLTGAEVIEEALSAALEPAPCDLAARLLTALEAGGRDGRGDARCTPLGRSSQAATLRAGPFSIDVGALAPGEGDDPLVTLRERFDEARIERPCPRDEAEDSASSSTGSQREEPPQEHEGAPGGGCSVHASDPFGTAPLLASLVLAWVAVLRARRPSWRGGCRIRRPPRCGSRRGRSR